MRNYAFVASSIEHRASSIEHRASSIERYPREAKRLYGAVDRCLAEVEFLAGEYSVADIACFP